MECRLLLSRNRFPMFLHLRLHLKSLRNLGMRRIHLSVHRPNLLSDQQPYLHQLHRALDVSHSHATTVPEHNHLPHLLEVDSYTRLTHFL